MLEVYSCEEFSVYRVGGKGVTPAPDCNCYLLRSGEEGLLVDVGATGEVVREVGDVEIVGVVLTHSHYDHAAAGPRALERGWRVGIHPAEAEVLREGDDRRSAAYLFGESMPAFDPSFTFRDGDVIEVGEVEVRVLHTPGHSPGSCCFLVEDVAFTGDTVFGFGPGRWDLPGGDRERLCESLERLLAVGVESIFPGHGFEVVGEAESAIESALREAEKDI